MISVDIAKEWTIFIPPNIPAAAKVAKDLSHYIVLLQGQSKVPEKAPQIKDMSAKSFGDAAPAIILNADADNRKRNGFSWRIKHERIEIFGESDRGLCNGVFDFLATLGFKWPEPGQELLPAAYDIKPHEYLIRENDAYHPSSVDTIRRRLVFDRQAPHKKWEASILWAVRNKIDTLVFSLQSAVIGNKALQQDKPSKQLPFLRPFRKLFAKNYYSQEDLFNLAEEYALTIELGGWDLSLLVPRRYFLLHRDMFRMDAGQRDKEYNFCPTAPDTIKTLKCEAEKIFRAYPRIGVYHLWPDRGHEKAWCACPTCRAFTLEEQNRIAVNAIADILVQINPHGTISYYENPPIKGGVFLRPNLFRVNCLPGEAGSEAGGWFLNKT